MIRRLFLLVLLSLLTANIAYSNGKTPKWTEIKAGFESFCFSCHDEDISKGGVRLDNLSQLKLDARLDLLNKVQEQLYSGNMPPSDKKKQPGKAQRAMLFDWVAAYLKKHNASKLEDKLRYYRYANYIDHDKLFSGEITTKPFTPSRRWLVNSIIYNERINDVFRLQGQARQKEFFGVVKPFNQTSESGVKYYASGVLGGGEFLTLLSNAEWVVERQLRPALLKSGEFKYSEYYLDLKKNKPRSIVYKFPEELWNLTTTEKEFEQIIMSEQFPSDSDIKLAINHQFAGALQRKATSKEMTRYLNFTKEAMKVGGNTMGLKKMMTAVLMEPDFVYRREYGAGSPDTYGRLMLSPREASYAIAYALTDNIPDAALVKAAESGRLTSKKDYEREVKRILADDKIAKPRLLRFFQDYFGYYNILNVFKDPERLPGRYNPRRIVAREYTFGIPGKVAKEADLLVEWILKKDKNVLKELLTTDKFFVQYHEDEKKRQFLMEKAIAQDKLARKIYKYLITIDWKKNEKNVEKLVEEAIGEEFNQSRKKYGYIRPAVRPGDLHDFMFKSERRYGKDGNAPDKTPIPMMTEQDSIVLYNFDHLTWSYEPNQPFKVENRMGLLTHPAWLVSHSQNSHTDPILRGKWIQEKLLAGFVPDVPITVDAKIPEDHHKTLRERFASTEKRDCWGCHKKMNPLGYVFESYDDFGRYRQEEQLEHKDNIIGHEEKFARKFGWHVYKVPIYKTKKINTEGYLKGTFDENLDGKVKDYKDLITRLANSTRVRQSFIRNAFRYFMGRNEMFSDSPTLVAADKAYVESGGSFKALVVSLLTSDSFIYRKEMED